VLCGANALAAQERIQLGAHVHGHGKLDMALEGQQLEMALNVPGMDIVGFEHEAHSQEDKGAISKARESLAQGVKLFGLPKAAHCKQLSSNVEISHEKEHEKGHKHEGEHGAFQVSYQFECAAPQHLTSLQFAPFFTRFPNSHELDIAFISAKSQQKFEVRRDQPVLEGMKP